MSEIVFDPELEALIAAAEKQEAGVETPPAPAADPVPEPPPGSEDAPETGTPPEPATPAAAPVAADPTLLEMVRANAQMAAALANAQKAAAPAAPAPAPATPAALYEDDDLALTPDEEESYKSASPTIQKLVRQQIKAYHDRHGAALQAALDEARAQIARVQESAAQTDDRAFGQQLHAAIPNLAKATASPEWKAYLAKPLPMSGGKVTIEQALAHNVGQRNLDAIREIVSGFAAPAAPVAPVSLAPGKAQATVPAHRPLTKAPQTFAYSKFTSASDAAQAGRMTYADYTKIQNAFLEAEAEGRVDYSA